MKQKASIGIGLLMIVVTVIAVLFLFQAPKKNSGKGNKQQLQMAFYDQVFNDSIPIIVHSNGLVYASNKIEIYSEVQGIFKEEPKPFEPGSTFKYGETIINISNDEELAQLNAAKNNFYSSLLASMPDLKLDFPDSFDKWENYLSKLEQEKSIPALPAMTDNKEKYFISGRGILSNYYTAKNLEVRLSKYHIKAPFNGQLSETFVDIGTLIRPGQLLAEYIQPDNYEIEVPIHLNYLNRISIGQEVGLSNMDETMHYEGIIKSINPKADPNSQTFRIYITLKSKDLVEGMYLKASIHAQTESDAFVINRNLLMNKSEVYIIQDSTLQLQRVDPVYFNSKTVVIKGLKDHTEILSAPIANAYPGMKIQPMESKAPQAQTADQSSIK